MLRVGGMFVLVLSGLLLGWHTHTQAQPNTTQTQTTPPQRAPLNVTLPEPKEHLLTPSEPTPTGDVPLLRRFIPGLADQMKELTPFLRDTSLILHLRTFYFNSLNSNDTQNEAWAFGGWLAYKSGWLWDTFAVGAVGYTSQPLYAPETTPGTNLLAPPQNPILVWGQAYGQLRYKDYALLTGYRQLVDEGYVNLNDTRMVPNTLEGVTLTGKVGPVGYNVGYLTAIKVREEGSFQNMAEAAGVLGHNRGLILTRLSSDPFPGLYLFAANYYVPDVFNTAYGHAEYTYDFAKDTSFKIGIQYTDQRSVGAQFLGNFATWNVGTRAIFEWRGLAMGAGFTATGDNAALSTPYGAWPGYFHFQVTDFDQANQNAWGAGVRYDFGGGTLIPGFRIPGLALLLRYAEGTNAVNPSTHADLPRVREGDLDITWNIPWLKGLQLRLRNAYVAQSGDRVQQQFRIIVNYEIPLL